jgi:hypothetical protein
MAKFTSYCSFHETKMLKSLSAEVHFAPLGGSSHCYRGFDLRFSEAKTGTRIPIRI